MVSVCANIWQWHSKFNTFIRAYSLRLSLGQQTWLQTTRAWSNFSSNMDLTSGCHTPGLWVKVYLNFVRAEDPASAERSTVFWLASAL